MSGISSKHQFVGFEIDFEVGEGNFHRLFERPSKVTEGLEILKASRVGWTEEHPNHVLYHQSSSIWKSQEATYIVSRGQGSVDNLGKLFILTKLGILTWEPVISALISAPHLPDSTTYRSFQVIEGQSVNILYQILLELLEPLPEWSQISFWEIGTSNQDLVPLREIW
jgi:hypothetical protein